MIKHKSMEHTNHINLIKKAITKKGGVWADFGSGEGAFTLALRDLAGPQVEIYSIDKDKEHLTRQKEAFGKQFPNTNIHFIEKDFTEVLKLPLLDGIVMANSLHYVKNQKDFLTSMRTYLKPQGKLILVEYSLDESKPPWVPYPLSYTAFERLAKQVGFKKIELLEKIPSTYWNEMYSAQALKIIHPSLQG